MNYHGVTEHCRKKVRGSQGVGGGNKCYTDLRNSCSGELGLPASDVITIERSLYHDHLYR